MKEKFDENDNRSGDGVWYIASSDCITVFSNDGEYCENLK